MRENLEKSSITKMNRLKFILLFKLVTFTLVRSKINYDMQIEKDSNNKIVQTGKNTIFGKSISEVENSVKSFILSLSVPLEKRLFQDFQKVSFKHNFKKSVSISTEVVVKNLRAFRRNLGIFKSNNSKDIKVSIPDKNDTIESILIYNGLVVATEFIDFAVNSADIGTKFFLGNRTAMTTFFKSNIWQKLQFMDFFIFTSEFFVYVDCIANDTLAKRTIRYLSSHSSSEVIKYLKKNLKKPTETGNFNATQNICYSFENIIPGGYEKCIYDLNNVYSCVQYQIPLSSQQGAKGYEFLKKMKKLFSRKWVSNVRVLEPSCKLKKGHQFECKFNDKKFKSTKNQVKYIIENSIGKQIKSGSSLSKVVNRFSRIVSKSPMTKSLTRNCCDYVAIWQAGQKRRAMLKKMSKNNSQALKEFKKVSKSFYNYKNGVVKQLLNAIIAFNQIPIYLENSLEKAFSKQLKETLFGSVLNYLSRLLQAIFDRNKRHYNYKTTAGIKYDKISQDLITIQEEFPDLQLRMTSEEALDNLMKTMNEISSQNRDVARKSAFNGGLTNILLALMFLETLSAVTLLMSQNINNAPVNEQIPVVNEEIPEIEQNTEDNNEEYEDEDINEEEEEENENEDKLGTQFASRKKRFLYPNNNAFFSNFPNSSLFSLRSLDNFVI